MNKVINSWYIGTPLMLILTSAFLAVHAQDSTLNRPGLLVISNPSVYRSTVRKDEGKEMVDLSKYVPGVVYDLRYASEDNFMKKKLYPELASTFMRKPAAVALAAVQKQLNRQGLRLKIFDAYRPYSITELMWEVVPDDRYAADPKKGSGHNRGTAVDLTVIDLYTKEPLDMGTDFDNFTDTAHQDFTTLPKEVLQNRVLLRSVMEKNGFRALETEWWHYSLDNDGSYELLDIPFEGFQKMSAAQSRKSAKKNVAG